MMQSWWQPIQDRMNAGGTLMHSWWDGVQQQRDRTFLQQGMQRMRAAQNAPYGSLAQQWDPSNYGSQFSQWAPSVLATPDGQQAYAGMLRRQRPTPYYMP